MPGDLFGDITSSTNIRAAIDAHCKRSKPGVDDVTWQSALANIDTFVRDIQARLHDYSPQPTRRIVAGGVAIEVPTVGERILQLSIARVLAARIRWGAPRKHQKMVFGERALAHHLRLLHLRYGPYVCYFDIEDYYHSISHSLCIALLQDRVCEHQTVKLIASVLDLKPGSAGIPVGYPLATLLGDNFLVLVDSELETPFVRFHDDYFGAMPTETECERFLATADTACRRIALKMNESKCRVIQDPKGYNDFINAN